MAICVLFSDAITRDEAVPSGAKDRKDGELVVEKTREKRENRTEAPAGEKNAIYIDIQKRLLTSWWRFSCLFLFFCFENLARCSNRA